MSIEEEQSKAAMPLCGSGAGDDVEDKIKEIFWSHPWLIKLPDKDYRWPLCDLVCLGHIAVSHNVVIVAAVALGNIDKSLLPAAKVSRGGCESRSTNVLQRLWLGRACFDDSIEMISF